MKAAEMIPLLDRWSSKHLEIEQADQALQKLTGRSPESPLCEALWGTFEAYTEFLETHLVGTAGFGWLGWYQFECKMGRSPKTAEAKGQQRTIATLDDLAQLLEDCH